MLQHNSGLTGSHPYASSPINWPFLLSGISFWTQSDTKEQVYMIGNIAGWWVCVMGLSVFVGIIGADLLARRRGIDPIPDRKWCYTAGSIQLQHRLRFTAVRNRLWNSAGFFWIAWAYHYFPFYLMSRQLFLHHYLPAHLCSALVAGAVFNFILSESINYPISIPSSITRLRPRQYSDLGIKALAASLAFVVLFITVFLFLAPLTYGTPGLVVSTSNQPSGWCVLWQSRWWSSQSSSTVILLDITFRRESRYVHVPPSWFVCLGKECRRIKDIWSTKSVATIVALPNTSCIRFKINIFVNSHMGGDGSNCIFAHWVRIFNLLGKQRTQTRPSTHTKTWWEDSSDSKENRLSTKRPLEQTHKKSWCYRKVWNGESPKWCWGLSSWPFCYSFHRGTVPLCESRWKRCVSFVLYHHYGIDCYEQMEITQHARYTCTFCGKVILHSFRKHPTRTQGLSCSLG